MCLACLFRLMDLRTRYTHVFSALASGRSASWAKLVMGETRGYRSSHVTILLGLVQVMAVAFVKQHGGLLLVFTVLSGGRKPV